MTSLAAPEVPDDRRIGPCRSPALPARPAQGSREPRRHELLLLCPIPRGRSHGAPDSPRDRHRGPGPPPRARLAEAPDGDGMSPYYAMCVAMYGGALAFAFLVQMYGLPAVLPLLAHFGVFNG